MTFKKRSDEFSPFAHFGIYIPNSLLALLKEKSTELKLPISRLINYAIDNEFTAPAPFNYPCNLPSSIYIRHAYADEAQKIAQYLLKFPGGTGRDTLLLHRRDMGVLDKNTFMLALRELIECGIVVERPPSRKAKFKYSPEYNYIQLKKITEKSKVLSKKKRLLADITALQTKLAQIEDDEDEPGEP